MNIISNKTIKPKIIHFESITSTNTYLMEQGKRGADTWTVVIADSQSGGRGRLGRSFESQNNSGLYMSILLRDVSGFEPSILTVIASVCISRAIEELTGLTMSIKWVNDIYYCGKKVCGILTEGAFENNSLSYAVIGIGVNISVPENGYSDSIKDIAGSVFDSYSTELRDKLASLIVQYLYECTNNYDHGSIYSEYVKRSCIIGKIVEVYGNGEPYNAKVKDIMNDFSLKVVKSDGTEIALKSGEVSLKM